MDEKGSQTAVEHPSAPAQIKERETYAGYPVLTMEEFARDFPRLPVPPDVEER